MSGEEYVLTSSGLGLPPDSSSGGGGGGSRSGGTNTNNNSNSNSSTYPGSEQQAVMNEKVQALAGSIYEEFEAMIARYDNEVVKNLMPLIVNVLENLDLSFTEMQEFEVEVELLKEDNEQLVTQYEREKQLRKAAEAKNMELEDNFEGERKELIMKIESLSSIVKMFELKAKNSQDHINRMEDKETEMKKEYGKLHDRYTELFKTHIDYMERTKSLIGAERMEQLHAFGSARSRISGMSLNQLNRSSGPISYGYTELENNNPLQSIVTPGTEFSGTAQGTHDKSASLRNELLSPNTSSANRNRNMIDKGGWMKGITPEAEIVDLEVEEAEDVSQDPSIGPATPSTPKHIGGSSSQTKSETRTANTLYQELSFQDSEALGDIDEGADITVNDNYFGMGKEVENLISENDELLATKNALNIVKDDLIAKVDELTGEHEILREEIKSLQTVRSRLQARIQELEEEVKRLKEEAEKNAKAAKPDGEEDEVPLAQRKRFTRVEMARVLMERNQYKERFMELQEAVRWTEMIRQSRTDAPSIDKKNKLGIWKFFGNLFSGNDRAMSGEAMIPYVNMKYSSEGGGEAGPALDTMRAKSAADRKAARGDSIFDGESLTSARRLNERKEQYKQVRAHVKKDDGRTQAYGWSLPAPPPRPPGVSSPTPSQESTSSNSKSGNIPVPVPVYCRPLQEKESGMKIWCAAGVNLSGGRTKDGGSIVGASVFYTEPPASEAEAEKIDAIKACDDELSKLDKELAESRSIVEEAFEAEKELSSHVWICTSTHSISKVTVIDANNPADVLESFHVCSSHLLCIASIPGAKESDYKVDEELNRLVVEESRADNDENEDDDDGEDKEGQGIGAVSFVTCAVGSDPPIVNPRENDDSEDEKETKPRLTKEKAVELGGKMSLNRTLDVYNMQELSDEPDPHSTLPFISHHTLNLSRDIEDAETSKEEVATEATEATDAVHRRFLKNPNPLVKDGVTEVSKDNTIAFNEVEKMSSVMATMWLGSQSGSIYVHSAVAQWKRCIHSIRLKDSVLNIVHVRGRVLVALADGSIAIFHRALDGQWDLSNYHLLDLGKPHHSIRCMTQVHSKVWCGYRNKIFVIDPRTMSVEKTFDAHPRKESQVRQMAWAGDGVWVSIRLDSTLRLYHAHNHQHLQDVDIEPYVSKMLGTGKLGFSFVRITSLLVSCHRLWMGTGNGVIISVPFTAPEINKPTSTQQIAAAVEKKVPGGVVRVYANSDRLVPESYIPFCSLAQAQLSFHGHRDAVKFFVSVPGTGGLTSTSSESTTENTMLVMSGGEGYIDFRIVDDGYDQDLDSHIMVWQLSKPEYSKIEKEEEEKQIQDEERQSQTHNPPSSMESSSIDLGPTPGSGVVTTADTSAESDNENNDDGNDDQEALQPLNLIKTVENEEEETATAHGEDVSGNKGTKDDNEEEEKIREPLEDFTQSPGHPDFSQQR